MRELPAGIPRSSGAGRGYGAVRDFSEQALGSRLWRIASRPTGRSGGLVGLQSLRLAPVRKRRDALARLGGDVVALACFLD